MLEGVELASTHIKGMIPVVALSPLVDRSSIDTLVRKSHLEVMVISGSAHKVIEASDAVVVASGTATLEAALMEIPMIVVYKTSWLSYMLARMLVKVRHVSLVNILAGQPIVPELLQGRMSASNIAMHLKEILREGHVRRKMIEDLRNIHHMLGDQRASQEAAKLALDLIMG
jgi:lipid-A-disaccharide synthase